jgi:hypothetical protein
MIEITQERYEELILAEQVAKQLKELIAVKYDTYGHIDREDIALLCTLFCKGDSE